MLHDRSALIDQLRAHLTQQRYNPVVIHNQCRGAEHFLSTWRSGTLPYIRQRLIT